MAQPRMKTAAPLTDADRKLITKVLSNPLLFPTIFKDWLVGFLGPEIQVTQSQVVNASLNVYEGSGSPESVQAAAVGSIYLRTDGGAGTTLYVKETGTGTTGWVARDVFTDGVTLTDGTDLTIGAGTGSKLGQDTSKLAFYGADPVAQPDAYTQTYDTADKTLDVASTTAFTGQDNTQTGDVYAKSADLEQLRQDLVDVAQTLNAVIDDLRTLGLIG